MFQAGTFSGIENLKELIAIHKDTPGIIEKRRQARAVSEFSQIRR
jgi:hypothetical protein